MTITRETLRFVELILAIYGTGLGWMFVAMPQEFAAYEAWSAVMPIEDWGLLWLTASLLHIFALWLNGRNRIMSKACRAVACGLHLTTLMLSIGFYAQIGAWWGVWSLTVFAAMTALVGSRVVGGLKYEVKNAHA
ncbi:MAG: hypothetical protein D6773_04445 [Alphaproteobacteria bacterium]|nr:MAG: hypothetical protein D6773_04445 [Alphaproteobacteria bacterium]